MTEQTQPTDAELLPLIEKHLGLKPRRDDTVIDPRTGRFHDAQRYRDFAADILAKLGPPAGAGEVAEVMFAEGKKYIQYTVPKELLPIGTKLYTTPQPTQAQAVAVPLTSEQERAIREAYESAGSESYFGSRPQIDTNDRRRVFKAGFERGWDAKTGADHA
jgi:hypothetical protein